MSKILIIFTTCLLFCSCGGSGRKDKDNTKTSDIQSGTQHNKPVVREPQLYATISYNKTISNERIIETDFISCSDYDGILSPIDVSLQLHSGLGKLQFSLKISTRHIDETRSYLPKGGRMLIKLDNGDVIELKQSRETRETSGRYERTIPRGEIFTYLSGIYPITEDEIRRIMTNTVTKVRIEKNAPTADYAYIDYKSSDVKQFSKALFAEYDAVRDAFLTENDFYSDF